MTKPMCPNCKNIDRGALLPYDHRGQFFFTRCGNCNHGYRFNSNGEIYSGHREQAPSNTRVAALRHLHDKLKSGDYDGTDVMAAWIAVEDLACLLERAENEPPAAREIENLAVAMWLDGLEIPEEATQPPGPVPKWKVGDRVKLGPKSAEFEIIGMRIVCDIGVSGKRVAVYDQDELLPPASKDARAESECEVFNIVHRGGLGPTKEVKP